MVNTVFLLFSFKTYKLWFKKLYGNNGKQKFVDAHIMIVLHCFVT